MKFKYQAKNRDGELQVGYVEAATRDDAVTILGGHSLFVLSLESAESTSFLDAIANFLARPGRKDFIIFARQLSTLLEARLPLTNAIKILCQQTTNAKLKEALVQVGEDIDGGLSFSQAMERQNQIFPRYYIEMVRASEVTGNLNEVSSFLADYAEKEGDLASKASSALIYPAIVLAIFIIVAFILVTFVFPSLGAVFAQNNVALPWYTQALLNISSFMSKWWPAIVIAFIVLGIVAFDYGATQEGQAILDELKLKLPIVNKVYRPVILARFGNSAALLVHGGIPIAQALEIISRMIDNTLYKEAVENIAQDVRQGVLLSESLAKSKDLFPDLVPQMIAVGETTGKMEDMFNRLSGIFTREADQLTSNLVDLIQPVLMIGMGLMVGLLFASVLIPIYRLTSSFS
ncbi:MAG TPA: type II secretion system F family protein [Candidatus Paceibacterota bacterium]|nr:type II secretion system F family protein [Candidatus Paceibacterota bacterium]